MIRPHFGLKISQLPAPITISRFEFNRAKISELRRSTGECDTGIESIVTLYSQKIKKKIDPTTFWSQNRPITSAHSLQNVISWSNSIMQRSQSSEGVRRSATRGSRAFLLYIPRKLKNNWFDHILVSKLVDNQRPVTQKLSVILDYSLFLSIVAN